MAIWKKDEQMYTAIQDLMRTYLMHDHTPNIEQQLRAFLSIRLLMDI